MKHKYFDIKNRASLYASCEFLTKLLFIVKAPANET